MTAHVYTKDSPWPDAKAGTIAVVHYGDYRRQEIWVLCGSNVGNWYPLGNQYGNRALQDPTVPQHPHWDDIVARGPVTILAATSKESYRAGWADGRRHLFEQVEQEYEWGPSEPEQADAAVLVAEAVAALDEPTFCTDVYVGNEGEFKCDRPAGHGDHHWHLLAEFGWPVEVPAAKRSVRMGDACGPEHTYREFCQYAAEAKS